MNRNILEGNLCVLHNHDTRLSFLIGLCLYIAFTNLEGRRAARCGSENSEISGERFAFKNSMVVHNSDEGRIFDECKKLQFSKKSFFLLFSIFFCFCFVLFCFWGLRNLFIMLTHRAQGQRCQCHACPSPDRSVPHKRQAQWEKPSHKRSRARS